MTTHFDVVVLGQGLAGTAVAWWMRWSNQKTLVIDRESSVTSSKVAAGLITPITGQKLVKTWRHGELWPTAIKFYGRVEDETRSRFFRQVAMVRVLGDAAESSLFQRRLTAGEYVGVACLPNQSLDPRWFVGQTCGFEMNPGGQLEVLEYLRASREFFRRDGVYVASDIDVCNEIILDGDRVRIPRLGITTDRVVFCQGIDAVENPWFRDVEFKPAKGEVLTLRIPSLAEHRVIHCGVWLAPIGGELFKAGSTYEWKQLDSRPTPKGRDEILLGLRRFLNVPVELISHEAAVRPIHRNQYPVVGCHPLSPQLSYLNGLGSKGALHAPFFANQLVAKLMTGGAIDPSVDLNRKTDWKPARKDDHADGDRGTTEFARGKHPANLPLTDQAQQAIRSVLTLGETAIDATAGNGHDTLFLANTVGPTGTVFAFDIQEFAIANTARRLNGLNFRNVTLLNRDHGELSSALPQSLLGRVGAVMFNLGYLPGGDKGVATNSQTTQRAIVQAVDFLRPGGLLTILAYTGHDGGEAEANAVSCVLDGFPEGEFQVKVVESQPGRSSGPRMFVVTRLSAIPNAV